MRTFGRAYIHDDRDYLMQVAASPVKRKTWRLPKTRLDQGNVPACVGYMSTHWLLSSPVRQYLGPLGIYAMAQYLDEWEGQDYDGTSVRAAMKVLRAFGYVAEFSMTQDVETLADAVCEVGPVGMGTVWTAGMSRPTSNGFIVPKGRVEGGHAWLVYKVDKRREFFGMLNSWGPAWGNNGTAMVSFASMEKLLLDDGEAWIGVETRPK